MNIDIVKPNSTQKPYTNDRFQVKSAGSLHNPQKQLKS
jgi:hypothetical protein